MPGRALQAAAAAGKPDSVLDGVRIGCITYSYRSQFSSAEDVLKALVQDGISEVELIGNTIQAYAGISGGAKPAKGAPAPVAKA